MLSDNAKRKLLPLFAEMQEIMKHDEGVRYGECLICGDSGKAIGRMGWNDQQLSFAETGMENPILCRNHSAGWSRSVNAKLFGSWFDSRDRPTAEDLQLHFSLWLATHLNKRANVAKHLESING
jgi:hypothetical protein